jgi:hypothetical protein
MGARIWDRCCWVSAGGCGRDGGVGRRAGRGVIRHVEELAGAAGRALALLSLLLLVVVVAVIIVNTLLLLSLLLFAIVIVIAEAGATKNAQTSNRPSMVFTSG